MLLGANAHRGLCITVALVLWAPPEAVGHAERPSFLPNHRLGEIPAYRRNGPSLIVCKRDSGQRIRARLAGRARRRNLRLLRRCEFRHIQAAVDRARNGHRVLILPGVYREEPSRRAPNPDPRCADELTTIPEAVRPQPSYEYQRECPNAQNLIAVVGDGPDRDQRCDRKCDLQIEGTGSSPHDVVIAGRGFGEQGGAKYNLIRADRADGLYLRNFTVQFADFNDVYVIETNGFRLERLVTRWSREYGVLSFASDNGLYDRVTAYGNGDSGLYPGSGPEGHCRRYGIEIRRSDVYRNTTGIAGTAGNGVWIHDNRVHHNALGFFFDSLGPRHPGMPQDCSRFERNRIYSNNLDLYTPRRDAYCNTTVRPVARRDPRTVCPAVPVPVGTGILIAGGNRNMIQRNWIYGHRRYGTMQFYAPPGIRGTDPTGQSEPPRAYDTSNGNAYRDNRMGVRPDGTADRNRLDFWWDGEGRRNCWSGNTGPQGRVPISSPRTLSRCPRGNRFSPGDTDKQAGLLPCAQWHPQTNPDPIGCDWTTAPNAAGRGGTAAFETALPTDLALGVVGDALRWIKAPRSIRLARLPDHRILVGVLQNRSPRQLRLRADDVVLQGIGGERIPASVAFLDGYARSLDPPDRDLPTELPEPEQHRLGHLADVAARGRLPLAIAWRSAVGDPAPARIAFPAGSLAIP